MNLSRLALCARARASREARTPLPFNLKTARNLQKPIGMHENGPRRRQSGLPEPNLTSQTGASWTAKHHCQGSPLRQSTCPAPPPLPLNTWKHPETYKNQQKCMKTDTAEPIRPARADSNLPGGSFPAGQTLALGSPSGQNTCLVLLSSCAQKDSLGPGALLAMRAQLYRQDALARRLTWPTWDLTWPK